jgi:hypothetical protein
MNYRPKMLIMSPIAIDCVSSWRALGPYSALTDYVEYRVVEAQKPVSEIWDQLLWCDILMAHRSFQPIHAITI